jgi:flagellar biosynthesis chaperone FliJ
LENCGASKSKSLSPDIVKLLEKVYKDMQKVKDVRNKYCHNLSEITPGKRINSKNASSNVDSFIKNLEDLNACIQNNKNKFQNIYWSIPRTSTKSNKKSR